MKLNVIFEKYIFSKTNKKLINFDLNLNEFWKVFFLRIIIPIPLLNYFLSIKNFKLGTSLIATFISLMPYVFIISGTSKNLISENIELNFNFNFVFLYLAYAVSIFFLSKLIKKMNFLKKFK